MWWMLSDKQLLKKINNPKNKLFKKFNKFVKSEGFDSKENNFVRDGQEFTRESLSRQEFNKFKYMLITGEID